MPYFFLFHRFLLPFFALYSLISFSFFTAFFPLHSSSSFYISSLFRVLSLIPPPSSSPSFKRSSFLLIFSCFLLFLLFSFCPYSFISCSASRRCGPGSIPGQVVWYLWWTEGRWGGTFSSTSVSPANSRFTNCSAFINHLIIDAEVSR
jgi:hypothetical protein